MKTGEFAYWDGTIDAKFDKKRPLKGIVVVEDDYHAFLVLPKDIKEADQSEKNKNVQVNHDMQKIGKKIAMPETKPAEVGGIAVERLRSLVERIERLEEEKAAVASDIRDIFAEAKSAGFDVKIMRMILKLRKMNAADRDEQEILLETYTKALDM